MTEDVEAPFVEMLFAEVLAASGRALAGTRVCQVEPDAAGGTVLGYAVAWRGAQDAGEDVLYLQPVPDDASPAEGEVVVQDRDTGRRHRLWRYPDDPALPALGAVVHADAARVVLDRLGVPGDEPVLELVSYRPGRRAVVRATAGDRVTYLKVVRPDRAALVHDKHRRLHDAGLPVPAPLGWSPAGVLALPAAPGVPALDLLPTLVADDRFVRALAALQERLAAAVDPSWRARRTPTLAVQWYADQVAAVAPALAARAQRIAARVTAHLPPAPAAGAGIHGDLHLDQLLVDPADPAVVSGLLDVDTAGPGDPEEDATAVLAHLEVVARGDGEDPTDPVVAAAARACAVWPDVLVRAPGAAAARRAAHLLAYALDPAGRGDLARATALLDAAEGAGR